MKYDYTQYYSKITIEQIINIYNNLVNKIANSKKKRKPGIACRNTKV